MHSTPPSLSRFQPAPVFPLAAGLLLVLLSWLLLSSCGKDDPDAIEAAQPPSHVYELGETISFGTRGKSHRHVLTGWGDTEPGFRWTDGTAAALAFRMPATNGGATLEVVASALTRQPQLPNQPVDVMIEGERIAHWEVAERKTYRAAVPEHLLSNAPTDWIVDFYIPKAVSPARLGLGADFRRLGLQVFELKFVAHGPTDARDEKAELRQP